MEHMKGFDRCSALVLCLEERISADNPVRVIDALVDAIDMKSLDFGHVEVSETGRPPYDPSMLLKLYFYGYYNGIRSSRKLARECGRNPELMWLRSYLAQRKRVRPGRGRLGVAFIQSEENNVHFWTRRVAAASQEAIERIFPTLTLSTAGESIFGAGSILKSVYRLSACKYLIRTFCTESR